MREQVRAYFDALSGLPLATRASGPAGAPIDLAAAILAIATKVREAHDRGRKLMFIGNGGSASIASHCAIDYGKNGGIRALCFNDGAALTCLANDLGYEQVFAAQVDLHAQPGDVLFAISSGGTSPNIHRAVEVARRRGCHVVTLSGFSPENPLRALGHLNFHVPSHRYGFVEITHLSLCHAILDLERERAARKASMQRFERVLVTGGAGYVGSSLVPKLLERGYGVTVLDLFIYGERIFEGLAGQPGLRQVKGDIRDPQAVARALAGCDAVIHLACISNDPSFDLNPELGKSINYDSFRPLVRAAREAGVRRFVYASTSSVYGVKSTPDVTEELPLEPITDYSRYKAMCEDVLAEERAPGFATVIVRPATVCGYAPRLRLDLSVNILTNHAINKGTITVFGGDQLRPNIHIEDMTDAYLVLLEQPDEKVDGQVFNAGYQNHSILEIASIVKRVVGEEVAVEREPTSDHRSYHVSSAKIERELGFVARRSVEDAVRDLKAAFDAGLVPDPFGDDRYYNIRRMKALELG